MVRVLHILPHRGGGAERYLDLLAGLHGYEHERAPLSAGRTPLAGAASIPLRWPGIALAARRADLVHAHGDVAAALALPLLLTRPSVVTTHGLHFLRRAEGARRTLAVRAMRGVARAAGRIVCTSHAERDELAALFSPRLAARLTVVHNGVGPVAPAGPAARADARVALGLDPDDVAVLFLGELSERKAPLDAVEAARRAAADGARVVLLVAGDGPQAGELRLRASGAVRALGQRDDPARLLGAADAFILPSSREGLSFAVLEAMAAGLAMVVSDGAGNPEAVGDAGVVVAAGDVAGFAAALRALAADPVERARLGAAARERARSQFGLERMLGGIGEVYAAVLEDA